MLTLRLTQFTALAFLHTERSGMNNFTNFDDLIKHLKENNYGKEAMQSFLFSMYGVHLTNENGIKSSLVIVDNSNNVTLNVTNTLPEIDTTLVLDNNKWLYRVYVTSDYGEGYIYYEKLNDK